MFSVKLSIYLSLGYYSMIISKCKRILDYKIGYLFNFGCPTVRFYQFGPIKCNYDVLANEVE